MRWQHDVALDRSVASRGSARSTRRLRILRTRLAGLLVVVAAIAAAVDQPSPGSSASRGSLPSTAPSPSPAAPRSEHRRALGDTERSVPVGAAVSERRGPLGEADGSVPDGTSVFDDEVPGVAKLDPELLGALRQAATDAAGDGVKFVVDSGWRSPEYQARLLREAVLKYGSDEEAARWVATPDTSAHVSGDAVDIGPSRGAAWLSAHGAAYGLCQIYGNESWHFELHPEAIDQGCPPVYADAAHDPRMQQ